MADDPTFPVANIIEAIGRKLNLNVVCEGFDDVAFGVVITNNATFAQFLSKHKAVFNFLVLDIIDAGIPTIKCIRRDYEDEDSIDVIINQRECIPPSEGQPAIKYTRVDPFSLPRGIELQYISHDRAFAINTQYARNEGAKTQQAIASVAVDFILSDVQARTLAYDLLYRMWSQQLTIGFIHPNLYIEPSDIVQLITDQGTFIVQILTSMITKEPMGVTGMGRVNQLVSQILLTQRPAVVIGGGSVLSSTSTEGIFHTTSTPTSHFIGNGGGTSPSDGDITLDAAILQNTRGYSENLPKDVPPGYDWYEGYIHDFTAPPSGFTAMTGYGHIYQIAGTSDITISGLLELRNSKSWVQLSDFSWVEVQDETTINGAHFIGDFSNNMSNPMDVNDIGGGIWTMDGPPVGYNNHWWMDGRGTYTAGTVIAAFTLYEIRVTDTLDADRLVAGAGIDWWLDASAGYVDPVGTNNPAAGIGNWVQITTEFKPVCFYSHATSAAFAANPPPHVV